MGPASACEVPGFNVGGKTGTADKVVNGRYASDKNFNAFLSAFPIDDPQYVVLSFIDEPKTEKPGMAARRPQRRADGGEYHPPLGALLGVKPNSARKAALLVSY
jgi:cell division protein FtsI (penicillin-binding protein 3)